MAARTSASCLARFAKASVSSTPARAANRPHNLRSQLQARYSLSRSFSVSPAQFVKKYTEEHEWIELAADGKTGTIGISTYAANALGDVVFVELPTLDSEYTAGDAIGAVESVKSASDILTPVSGKIIEANNMLEEKPSEINKSPEEGAWLAKIELTNAEELDGLMDAEAYKAFTEDVDEDH